MPIVKAAVAYDNPDTGETLVLHILLNQKQMRMNGLIMEDVLKCLSHSSSHSIIIKEENVEILLQLKGIIFYFKERTPTI